MDIQGVAENTARCDLCQADIRFRTPGDWILRVVKCDTCGECTAVGPPPPNNLFTRCPYCMYLLVAPVGATVAVCPRIRCGRQLQFPPFTKEPGKLVPVSGANSSIILFTNKEIGKGGFGTVYAGIFGTTQCCAKVLNVPPQLDEQEMEKFALPTFSETMRPLCALSHPDLVKYLGVTSHTISDLPLIAMELVKGNLFHFLGHVSDPLPLHVQLDFSHDVALALRYLHEQHIVHGNLSSVSVFLTREGRVKVSDYELLSVYSFISVEQIEPLMLPYVPPEAFSVPAVQSKYTDCFSWSVLVLQIITQMFPNPGPRVKEVTDPRTVGKPMKVPVSEVSRRKIHIDFVEDTNPLLSVLVLGLDDIWEKRPPMKEVSEMVSTIRLSEEYKISRSKGSDWCERHMYVFEYELVNILGKSQPADARSESHMVDGVCANLSKLSLQNDRVTPGEELKDSEIVTTDERYEGVSFSGGSFPEHSESANGHRPAPPLYSEVCPCLDLPSTEDAGPSEVPIPSPPPISSPPPYTLLPEELPQQLSSSSTAEHEQTLCDFQCAACKFKTKFAVPVGKRVGLVRCSKCKECTPLVPPPDGKVYGRCAFCKCLILYTPTATAIVCPRETCKKLLFASTTSGKMMRRVPCEVCGYVMRIIKDPHDLVSSNIHVCSQCGEKNPIGPAPPGKMYTRCPYCNVLLQHNRFSGRVQCQKETCKKMIEVGDGEKLSVECSTCKKNIVYYGDKKVVLCGHCGNTLFVGKPPDGKIYIRCKNCNVLLIVNKGATAAKCPIKTCGMVMMV